MVLGKQLSQMFKILTVWGVFQSAQATMFPPSQHSLMTNCYPGSPMLISDFCHGQIYNYGLPGSFPVAGSSIYNPALDYNYIPGIGRTYGALGEFNYFDPRVSWGYPPSIINGARIWGAPMVPTYNYSGWGGCTGMPLYFR